MRGTTCSRRLFWALSTLCAAVPLAGGDDPPTLPDKDFSDATAYAVQRVERGAVIVDIDGEETRLRLVGVDSRSTGGTRKQEDAQDLQRFLERLLLGELVYIEFASDETKEDRLGRLPAYIYRAPEGVPVNLEAIRQGYARLDKSGKLRDREVFEHYAKAARKAKKGVWRRVGESTNRADRSLGEDKSESDTKTEIGAVWVTKYGKKYHRSTCRFLTDTKKAVSLEKARKIRKPCLVCEPPK